MNRVGVLLIKQMQQQQQPQANGIDKSDKNCIIS